MDKRFRISFFPSDASRVKVVSFRRKLGILAAAILVPLSLTGFWLLLSGTLHEPVETRQLRGKLAQENRALEARMGNLDEELMGLRGDISKLEERKVDALLLSGIGYMEGEKQKKSSGLFSFFRDLSKRNIDVSASLERARRLSASLDTTLQVLARNGPLVEGLPTAYPVDRGAIVTREYGYGPDPFTGRKALHAGVDFSLRAGAPVRAAGAGVVLEAGKDLLWGQCVMVDHGRGILTFYAHLDGLSVRPGQRVSRGDLLGAMGMTGVSTGVHLHYELTIRGSKVDPMRFFLPEPILAKGTEGGKEGP